MNATRRWIAAATTALLMASGEGGCGDFNRPGNKQPAVPVPSAPLRIDFEVTSNPAKHAVVTIDVWDHAGLAAVDVVTGELYPTQHIRRLPYGHWFMHPPTTSATYRVEAYITGEEGDLLGCAFYIDGVKLQEVGTPHVNQIEEGQNSTHVLCEHAHYPVTG